MTATISSAANSLVKRYRLLAERKHRRRQGAFTVEGRQPVWRAVEAGWPIEALIAAPDLLAGSAAAAMVAEQEARGVRVAYVSGELFRRLGDRDGPSGLAAIVRTRAAELSDLTAGPDAVFTALYRIGNPGNLGTIIRTVDATGGSGVITIGDSTDPFAPAAVKASMGSLFAVPVAHAPDADTLFAWAEAAGIEVLATSGGAGTEHWHAEYHPPLAVLFGAEGAGLPEDLLCRASRRIRIPMTGTAESLNLAAAAAVILYEIRRPTAGGLTPGGPAFGELAAGGPAPGELGRDGPAPGGSAFGELPAGGPTAGGSGRDGPAPGGSAPAGPAAGGSA